MKNIICSLIILLSWSCKSDKFGDFYIPFTIEGMVYLEDTIRQNPSKIAIETTVFLSKYTTIADPHLSETKTDKEGKFKFEFKPEKGIICIIGKYVDNDKVLYTNAVRVDDFIKNPTLTLYPRYPKGKLKIIVKENFLVPDKTDTNKTNTIEEPINGAEVFLFVNRKQAQSISETQPTGFIQSSKTTNERGISLFYDLPMGTYFVAAKKGKQVVSPMEIKIEKANVENYAKFDSLVLTPDVAPTLPSINITVKYDDEPSFNSQVFLFVNKTQAESINLKPANFLDRQFTDKNGKVTFKSLSTTSYYIAAVDTVVNSNHVKQTVRAFSSKITILNAPKDTSLTLQ